MSSSRIVTALALPSSSLVGRRVPKRMLAEQGAPTLADKRELQDGIEELTWLAALKPTTIGVPSFQDAERQYLEIAVLTAFFRPRARVSRLIEILHRAIPYPVLLITEHGKDCQFSVAHKRWAQNEGGKVVVDEMRTLAFAGGVFNSQDEDFLASLDVAQLPSGNLHALYEGILARILASEAARITGSYQVPATGADIALLRNGLAEYTHGVRRLAALRSDSRKEAPLNRRVELNLEIKRLETQLSSLFSHRVTE